MGLNAVGKVKQTTTVALTDPVTRRPLPGPKGKPMAVQLHGPYSKRYKAAVRAAQQTLMQDDGTLAEGVADTFGTDVLIACIESWNVSLEGDDVLPCTPEMIRQVFEAHPWVQTQIEAAFGNTASFLERPKPA